MHCRSVSRHGRNGYDRRPFANLPSRMKSNVVAALILILVGLLFLANNLGWTNLSLGKLIATWWPAALVACGVGMLFGRGK